MGLFNFFKRDDNSLVENNSVALGLPEIPEDIFIEKPGSSEPLGKHQEVDGISTLYNFLQKDFESIGYNDSLTSPDDSYKNDNIRLIRYDLKILIHKVMTYYESMLKDLDFHINSRSRAGLIDLVEELKIRREDVLEHVEKVNSLEQDLNNETGLYERTILSYKRGFMKGMAAITQANLLSKKL